MIHNKVDLGVLIFLIKAAEKFEAAFIRIFICLLF